MDIIDRLNDDEMYVDAIDDAIREIETLRTIANERLTLCKDALDSLEFVDRVAPELAGYGVRAQRIEQLRDAIANT